MFGGNHKSSCVGERGNKLLAANLCLLPHLLTSPYVLFSIVTKLIFFAALLHEMRQRPRRHLKKTAPQHILGLNPSKKPPKAGWEEEQKGARLIKGEKKRMIFPPPSFLPASLLPLSLQRTEREEGKGKGGGYVIAPLLGPPPPPFPSFPTRQITNFPPPPTSPFPS